MSSCSMQARPLTPSLFVYWPLGGAQRTLTFEKTMERRGILSPVWDRTHSFHKRAVTLRHTAAIYMGAVSLGSSCSSCVVYWWESWDGVEWVPKWVSLRVDSVWWPCMWTVTWANSGCRTVEYHEKLTSALDLQQRMVNPYSPIVNNCNTVV
jgi:hypothetical protein